MDIVICYDVGGERTRAIHSFLSEYLNWVQQSVFEGSVDEQEYNSILSWIERFVDDGELVMVYNLSEGETIEIGDAQTTNDGAFVTGDTGTTCDLSGRFFSEDSVSASPTVSIGTETVSLADADTSISWSDIPVVSMGDAFDSFFGIDEARQFEVTIAKPIPQKYTIDNTEVTLKKPGSELAKAALTVDGSPWTIEHPSSGRVTQSSEMRGLFSDPEYSWVDEALTATLSVPTNDSEAEEYLRENDNVSIGFYNQISTDGLESGIDGYQVSLIIDHVSSVSHGRCDDTDGCKVHIGNDTGNSTDASVSSTENREVPSFVSDSQYPHVNINTVRDKSVSFDDINYQRNID